MAQVVLLESNNEDLFFCGNCKHVFTTLPMFLEHKNLKCNNTEKAIDPTQSQCDIVDCGSTVVKESRDKILETSKEFCDELNCRFCKRKFKKSKSLQAHLKLHSEKPYQCFVCGRCFIQNSHLQRHILSHKVWPDGLSQTTARSTDVDILSYTCLYCDLILSSYSQFRSHMKNHMTLKKYKCVQGQCNSFYETVESLIHHVSSVHTSPKYSCHSCFKLFNSLEEIAAHYKSNDTTCITTFLQNEQFKCMQCDAVFRKADKLSLHMLTESHKKPCVYCNKIFVSSKRLRMHLHTHRKYKPFQCNICNQSFLMKKYLTTHMLRHGDQRFTCSICKGTYKRKDLLQRHMKSHQLRKLYKCPFRDTLDCQKEFSRRDKLNIHIKHHTKKLTSNSSNTPSSSIF